MMLRVGRRRGGRRGVQRSRRGRGATSASLGGRDLARGWVGGWSWHLGGRPVRRAAQQRAWHVSARGPLSGMPACPFPMWRGVQREPSCGSAEEVRARGEEGLAAARGALGRCDARGALRVARSKGRAPTRGCRQVAYIACAMASKILLIFSTESMWPSPLSLEWTSLPSTVTSIAPEVVGVGAPSTSTVLPNFWATAFFRDLNLGAYLFSGGRRRGRRGEGARARGCG